MERTIISWNVPNWITVVLMAALGYLVLGIGAQLVLGQFGTQKPPTSAISSGGF